MTAKRPGRPCKYDDKRCVSISVALPRPLVDWLRKSASQNGQSVNLFLINLLLRTQGKNPAEADSLDIDEFSEIESVYYKAAKQ